MPSGDLTGQGLPVQAAEGVAFQNAKVAAFNDPVSHGDLPAPASEFRATIDWGDGRLVTSGQVQLVSVTGDYVVSGSHTYAENTVTPYPITVTIVDPPESVGALPATLTLKTTAVVAESPFGDNDLTGHGVPVQGTENVPPAQPVEVATFNDPVSHGGQPDPTSEYTVTINWGDGSPVDSTAKVQVVNNSGGYAVLASHTYAEDSVTPYPIAVTISDPSDAAGTLPTTLTLRTTGVIAENPSGDHDLTGQGTPVQGTEGVPPTKAIQVATFNDPVSHGGLPDPGREYTVTIDWGDGSPLDTTTGQVQPLDGRGDYTVYGRHTYAKNSVTPYSITITISDPPASSTLPADTLMLTTTAVIAGSPSGHKDLTRQAAAPITEPVLGTLSAQLPAFNDPVSFGGQADPTSEYTVTIDWGDGSPPSTAQVQSVNAKGDYPASGSHMYTQSGTFKVTITISDPADDPLQQPFMLTLTTTVTIG
jgi:hypothetical protein